MHRRQFIEVSGAVALMAAAGALSYRDARAQAAYSAVDLGVPDGFDEVTPVAINNNGVAVGVLMMIPVLVALARTAPSRWERWLHGFLAIGMLYRGISTFSRGGFLAAIALGVSYVLRSDKKFRALAAAAIAATIVFSVMPDRFWERMDTITSVEEEGEDVDRSISGRLHFWSVAVTMARNKPIFGVGYNAYNIAYDRYDFSAGEFGAKRSVRHSSLPRRLSPIRRRAREKRLRAAGPRTPVTAATSSCPRPP